MSSVKNFSQSHFSDLHQWVINIGLKMYTLDRVAIVYLNKTRLIFSSGYPRNVDRNHNYPNSDLFLNSIFIMASLTAEKVVLVVEAGDAVVYSGDFCFNSSRSSNYDIDFLDQPFLTEFGLLDAMLDNTGNVKVLKGFLDLFDGGGND